MSATITTLRGEATQQFPTVVLRLQEDMHRRIEAEAQDTRQEIESHPRLTAEAADRIINGRFDRLNCTLLSSSDQLRAWILAQKPAPPAPDASPAELGSYEADLHNYVVFATWAATVIDRLVQWFTQLFQKIREFFENLWSWIKSKLQDIGERVVAFLKFVKKSFDGLCTYLFP